MTVETTKQENTYEIKICALGKEIFAIALAVPDSSNRILLGGLVTVFCVITIIVAYGSQLVNIFKTLTG